MTPSLSGHRPTLRAARPHRFLVVGLVILLTIALGAPSAGIAVHAKEAPSLYTVRERFGVNIAFSLPGEPSFPGRLSDYPGATELGFGWYSDWRVDINPPRPDGIEYAQLIQTRRWPPNWGHIENVVQANPGSLWIIGNEPETRGQGQNTPEEYAAIYHDAYTTLKQLDPTAQVAIGGVVMPTPLRLKWLEQTLDYYETTYGQPMPVDVWNIHVQILQEKRDGWGCGIPFGLTEDVGRLYEPQDNASVPIFEQLIWDFRQWLYERGEGHKELIISEYGVLLPSYFFPNGDEAVTAFMEGTFDFMLHTRDETLGCPADGGRLVQRWMWFSLNFPSFDEMTGVGFNGALMNWQQPDEFTYLGLSFRDYVARATNPPPEVFHLWLPYTLDR